MSSNAELRRTAFVAAAVVPLAIVAVTKPPRVVARPQCGDRLTAVIRSDVVVVDDANASIDARVSGVDASLPSIAGRVESFRDSTRYRPSYAFLPGERYRLRATTTACRATLDTTFVVEKYRSSERARVVTVYPTANVLPMNQLKMYVQFSAPMRAGEAAAHARIVDDATGQTVPGAFYSLDDELWDLAQTRLTLLFDPGRIKRGLRPNEELGLPLRAGRRYRLVIDRTWLDANGDTLAAGFEKRFRVGSPDRMAPRVATWTTSSPHAGSLDTLRVAFNEPLDQALLERSFVVRDASGKSVEGISVVHAGETGWLLVPARRWSAGSHAIDVDTDLEDLAGNNLRRLFDTDLTDHSAPTLERGKTATIPFTVSVRAEPRSDGVEDSRSSPQRGPAIGRIAIPRLPLVSLGVTRNDTAATSWLHVGTPTIASGDIITFAPDGLLMLGDSRSSTVFALDVNDTGTSAPTDVTLRDIDAKVASLLGTTPREIAIRDMAVHPRSHNVYIAVTRGRDAAARPAIVRVSARGKLDVVSLNAIPFAQITLPNAPSASGIVEGDSARVWTISAMSVVNNKLYIAGMSNEEFSSIVRQVAIPFDNVVSSTALRVYHTHHVRYETDSPITAFAPYTFFGRTFLVAAYSCTPIALYNLDSLQAGAKVTGRTIAELGGGNVVRDIVPFDYEGKRYLAISNRNRSLQIMNATALPNAPLLDEHTPNPLATVQPGLASWIGWGLEHGNVAQVGILHLSDFDEHHLIAIQRDIDSGSLNLRPITKPFLYP